MPGLEGVLSEAKRRVFEEFARIGKAVSSAPRLLLLDLLAQGEKPVERLAEQSGLGVKNTSAHLRRLRAAKLVETRREGTRVHYRLATPAVFEFLRALQALGATRLPEVRELVRDYFESPYDLDGIAAPELLRRVRGGQVMLLDVRPNDEFQAGHVPGAVSVPLEELEAWIGRVEPGREVVAYCRGPYCVFAREAVEALRAHGIEARRATWGLADWRGEGHPVEAKST